MSDDKKAPVWVYFIGAVVCVLLLSMGTIGNVLEERSMNRCSGELLVGCTSTNTRQYLEAPYHGGRVYTMYDHYASYTWQVDGQTYRVDMRYSSRNNNNRLPEAIDVKYNPGDPSEYWIFLDPSLDIGVMVQTYSKNGRIYKPIY